MLQGAPRTHRAQFFSRRLRSRCMSELLCPCPSPAGQPHTRMTQLLCRSACRSHLSALEVAKRTGNLSLAQHGASATLGAATTLLHIQHHHQLKFPHCSAMPQESRPQTQHSWTRELLERMVGSQNHLKGAFSVQGDYVEVKKGLWPRVVNYAPPGSRERSVEAILGLGHAVPTA